jgi:putative exosortase-associated protein (TIGR04073 family)
MIRWQWLAVAISVTAAISPAVHAEDANRADSAIPNDTHVAVGVEDFNPGRASGSGPYSAGDKLLRGLANVFTGFIEIPRNMYNTTQERNLLEGLMVGLAKGVGYTGLRMLSGAYETVTFPFPVPDRFEPIIRPAYVWQAPGPRFLSDDERRTSALPENQ